MIEQVFKGLTSNQDHLERFARILEKGLCKIKKVHMNLKFREQSRILLGFLVRILKIQETAKAGFTDSPLKILDIFPGAPWTFHTFLKIKL